MIPYNSPMCFIYFGVLLCIFDGAAQPIFGLVFSRIMTLFTKPIDFDETACITDAADPLYDRDC